MASPSSISSSASPNVSEDSTYRKRRHSDSPFSDTRYGRFLFSDSIHSNTSTSKLSREDLESFGIFYAKDPIDLECLVSKVKGTSQRLNVPNFIPLFEKLMKEKITFSLDMKYLDQPSNFHDITNYQYEISPVLNKDIKAIHKLFMDSYRNVHKEVPPFEEVSEGDLEVFIRLYHSWLSFLAPEFLGACQELMAMFSSMRNSSKSPDYVTQIPEQAFTNFLKEYTRMLFLTPSLSDSYDRGEMHIKGQRISSVPDVVFLEECEDSNKGIPADQVVMITEVQRSAIRIPSDNQEGETWIGDRLSEDVLGQVGSQLLIKRPVSSFRPYVLGILCMRTEVMFILLEMTHDHLWKIQNNKDLSGERTIIQYTKTFDYMKAKDRAQICGFILWLGCVQKHSFRTFILGD